MGHYGVSHDLKQTITEKQTAGHDGPLLQTIRQNQVHE